MKMLFALAAMLLCILVSLGCRGDSAQTTSEEVETVGSLRGAAVEPDDVSLGVWDREPALTWSLEPDLRIGAVEGGGEDVFGRIRNVIPDGDGGVWVYDQQAYELRHFDAEGNHLQSVGRRGEGPGEFSGNACARRGADGEIWVETETNWHRFDAMGQLIGTFPTPSKMACAVRTWSPNGRYVSADGGFDWETRTRRSYLVVHEWADGAMMPVDTFAPPDLPEPETVTFVNASGRSQSTDFIPFTHAASWRLENGGLLWVWDGDRAYEIRLQSLRGDAIRRVSRRYSPVRIEPDVRRQAIADFQRPGWRAVTDFDASRVPRVYPPFSSVRLAADGSVWVRRQTGEGETTWEVFAEDDRYLGAVEVPVTLKTISLRHIGSDHVWGILRDDLNVQYIVRARILKPER